MLISMPTGTSTIFGVFQAIWLSFLDPDAYKLVPNEKIASEIFFFGNGAGGLCCTAKRWRRTAANGSKPAVYQ
jgi:hypothetical protein